MSTKSNSAPQALYLSAEEVRKLLEDKSTATRIDLTHKIAGAYEHNQFSEKENKASEQIFRLLLRDTELRVRVSLAEHIKHSSHIPKDIVMPLARDVEEVALPILQYSEVLDDNDLVELINSTQEITRYLAVSKRERVSDVVSDTLIAKGNDQVAEALVNNDGAQLSEKGLGKIIETYSNNDSLMKAVVNHPRLPAATAEKLIHVVSSSLAETLKQKYALSSGQIEKEVEKMREGETLGLLRHHHNQEEIDKLVGQLQSFNRLTPSIILSALCQGNAAFFETSLARLSHIPVSNARTLISDRGELGFRAIYNKSGLIDVMFPAVKMLLRVVRELEAEGIYPATSLYANRVVDRLLQYASETPVDNLSYIIALVRQTNS